tara:strand:+ start:4196 stop:4441 length:246 start_codon:yes stop_codon:yes gene_type:complete
MKTKHLEIDWEISPNNIVVIEYDYYCESGDYESPPYEELVITNMILNGDNVTDRFENYEEEILDYIITQGEYNIDSPLNDI